MAVTDTGPGRQWVENPQSLRWRRFLVQVHLWVGVVLCAYVFVLSLSGSLIVLRPQFHRWITQPEIAARGAPAADEALDRALRSAYAGFEVRSVRKPRRQNIPYIIYLEREGAATERLFDPYALRDIGSANPPVLKAVEWLVDLHDNLLGGRTGRAVNGAGGCLLLVLALTGLVVWWPGKSRWTGALVCGAPARTRRFARRLHVSLGFWISGLLLVWATTALYFGFPDPFEDVPDAVTAQMVRLHFGRFGDYTGRVAWMILGLVPAVLAVTGMILWWPWRRKT